MKHDIILLGGGGHCKSCIDVIEQENKYNIIGILDKEELSGSNILGYEIIGTDDDLKKFAKNIYSYLITVGQIKSPQTRIALFNLVKSYKVKLPVIISPNAYVSRSAKIGEGSIIMHHALVNSDAIIGVNCIINSKALVEHDSGIGDHCHIATGSIVNGGVIIGAGSFLGSNVVTRQYISIPDNSIIQANTFLNK